MKDANINYFLGVDWGGSKIGLALADSETRIAFPLGILKNNKLLFKELQSIVKERNIGDVILGTLPQFYQSEKNFNESDISKLLRRRLGVRVHLQDEMLTTKMAQTNLVQSGAKKIASQDDQEAARIILQDWLDKN